MESHARGSSPLTGMAVLLVLVATGHSATRAAPPDPKPHILWIITDDQRPDSVAAFNRIRYGHPESRLGYVTSPNVDRLAAMGTTFINAFNHNPSCAPSRTCMHTGRYSHHTGVYGFEYYDPTGMEHWRPMVPEILRDEAGYQTITVGKLGIRDQRFSRQNRGDGPRLYEMDLGYRKEFFAGGLVDWYQSAKWVKGKPGPRTEIFLFPDGSQLVWPESPDATPNDADALRQRLDIFRYYPPPGQKSNRPASLGEVLGGVNPQPPDRTRDASFVRALLEYLDHAGRSYTDLLGRSQQGPDPERPVFIHVGFEFPHTPVLPPANFRERFADKHYEIPVFTREEFAGFPPQIVKFFNNWGSDHFTAAEKQQMVRDYYAYCAYGDSLIGRLVDGFLHFAEKTKRPWLILYVCGDNGWKLNDHGMISKFCHYDEDLNNPIIVASSDQKRFPPGKVVTDLVGFVDIAPTFLAAAGIDISDPRYQYLDGRDLAQVAAGIVRPRDYIIAEPTWVIGPRAVIRTREFTFAMRIRPRLSNEVTPQTVGKDIRWAVDAPFEAVEPVLFDLRVDPRQRKNLAFEPAYRPVVDTLRKKLQDIVLGDRRVEVAWGAAPPKPVAVSTFAPGADDGILVLEHVPPVSGAEAR